MIRFIIIACVGVMLMCWTPDTPSIRSVMQLTSITYNKQRFSSSNTDKNRNSQCRLQHIDLISISTSFIPKQISNKFEINSQKQFLLKISMKILKN